MENLKVGQKVRIKSKEWYEACKCLGFKLPGDKAIFDMCHIGEVGKIECILSVWVSVKFNDGSSNFFQKGWLEPISDGWVSTDEDHKLNIPSDEELKKSVTVNVPSDMEVSTKECGGKITINVHHKEEKKEEPRFKDGDIIYSEDDEGRGWISIFNRIEDDVIYSYADFSLEDKIIYLHEEERTYNFGSIDELFNIRLATKEDIAEFNKEFAEQKHLKWNAEEFKFETIRWRSEHGERYWHITELGTVISSSDYHSPYDNILYNLRNYFQTEELAKQALPLYKDFFKNLNVR